MGRPAKYHKPHIRTYRVSAEHIERVNELRNVVPSCRSDSDIIEDAVLHFYKRRIPRRKRNGHAISDHHEPAVDYDTAPKTPRAKRG